MSLMAWLLGALALALLAAAALLLRQARDGARRQASEAFLERQLELRPGQPEASQAPAARRRLPISNGAWRQLLLRAGVEPTPRFLAASVGAHVGVPALAWLFGGWISAAAALLLVALLWYFHLWLKADRRRRRRRMVHQLPTFLDALVRLITIGNSVNAAFQNALGSVEQPLLEVLQRADSQVRSGKDLDAALHQVSRQYQLRELFLVSAVIALALRFGGRSDQVLERMAAFMRDLEQARDELTALSAEVRLSAWILALLPIGLALFIIIFNNQLFMGMWHDPMGFRLLVFAMLLQAGGSYWLYRMARSV
ncbi:type II secretion system F family protein [Bordetella bronchiseptica]|uniref:type II secretion system F family protein n=1 Tax=Bordetella bronchiseptica TaxID=518 RepID=UPI00403C24CD